MKAKLQSNPIFLMIEETTSTFNKAGRIATYSILTIIAICAVALVIGVATTDNLQFRY